MNAALKFGVCHLKVKHLIILGHSQCGGITELLHEQDLQQALLQSAENCKTFPWIAERLQSNQLQLHLWFFDIEQAELEAYSPENERFKLYDNYPTMRLQVSQLCLITPS